MSAVFNYIALVAMWFFFFSIVYLPLRYILLKHDTTLMHEFCLWLFYGSVFCILTQTLTTDGTVTGVQFSLDYIHDNELYSFVPFVIVKRIMGLADPAERLSFALVNVPGNILIFAPVGFFARAAFKMNTIKATLIGLGLSVFVEIGQIFLPRTTDIDDVIMNTMGALFGALIYGLINILIKRKGEKSNG